MNNVDKALLLAELFNTDVSSFIPGINSWLKDDTITKFLETQIETMKNYSTAKTRDIIKSYFEMSHHECETVEEALLTRSKFLHLLSLVTPTYYLNPLLKENPLNSNLTIGELEIEYDGKLFSLNKILDDKEHTMEFKLTAINKGLLNYRNEAANELVNPVKKISYHGLEHKLYTKIVDPFRFLQSMISLFGIIFVGYFLMAPNPNFKAVLQGTDSNIINYLAIYIPSGLLAISILLNIFYQGCRKYLFEGYYYFKRYLKNRSYKIGVTLDSSVKKLSTYIGATFSEGTHLDELYQKFALLDATSISINDFELLSKNANSPFLKRLRLANYIIFGLALLSLFGGVIMWMIGHYNGVIL